MKKEKFDIDNELNIDDEFVIDDEYGFEFNDELILKKNGSRVKHGKKSNGIHFVFFGIVIIAIIAVIVRVAIWNKGTTDDTAVVTDEDFDVEPNDYIQPLNAAQMEGKPDDGTNTILTLGNSPFADGAPDNNLARALAEAMDATVINGGIEESYLTQKNANYDSDYEYDGVSLYQISKALCDRDFSIPLSAASEVSENAVDTVKMLETVDMDVVDCIMIMYDLSDYVDHRPLAASEDATSVDNVYGALYSSLKLIQERYPYIRIVIISTPSCGKTIDDFFVDGDTYDLGNGTLTEYMTMELMAVSNVGVSFVDIYYGAINVENRDSYLYDDYHINDNGAALIAKRVAKLIKL